MTGQLAAIIAGAICLTTVFVISIYGAISMMLKDDTERWVRFYEEQQHFYEEQQTEELRKQASLN